MRKRNLKSLALACALTGACTLAAAQSSVTIYGIADAAVRYEHNANNRGDHALQLVSGGIAGSRLGFRGTEDLGGGMKALFNLEMGISLDDGMPRQGPAFGRASWVGLEGGWGRVSLGRQYNALNAAWNNYNPLGDQWGIYWSDPVYIGGDRFFMGYRINNSIIYSNKFGPVAIQLDYALGEQDTNTRDGSTYGGNVVYSDGPVTIALAADRNRAPTGAETTTNWTVGGKYGFTGGHYVSGGVMTSKLAVSGADYRIAFAGGGFRITPALLLSGAVYAYDQNGSTPQGAGKAKAIAFVADYAMSKRTSLYAEFDRTIAKDGAARSTAAYWATAPAGLTTLGRSGFMVGIRHRF
ncbi:MAG: porin [Ramlibacter sp.]|nr:porin [Ramlibacter sp.]